MTGQPAAGQPAPGQPTTGDMAASPYLSGRYAPVRAETDADRLPVEGTLPADINGVFMRNGPNPMFPPLGSYTYPLDGDGMIHAVWITGGTARYRNRWVRTRTLRAEEQAGRALRGGILTPDGAAQGPDAAWPGEPEPSAGIIRHAGHYLALQDGGPPHEVTAELDTAGSFDFGGALPLGICAHPRIDPRSGELVAFRAAARPPYLTWAAIGPDGSVTRPPTEIAGIDRPYLIHDFTITEHYALFIIGPALLDLAAAGGGGEVLSWHPELGTRIALVPRAGTGLVTIAELDPLWAWHFANAYEDDGRVVADFPWWSAPARGAGPAVAGTGKGAPRGALCRAAIDPARGRAALETLFDAPAAFPRIDDRLTGRRHRYVTVTADSGEHGLAPGEHDRLVRYDLAAGRADHWDTGASIGEAVFAPRHGTEAGELDGYYLSFARTLADDRSWLYVWDAGEFPRKPVARVAIPAAVPNGLHANWFPLHAA